MEYVIGPVLLLGLMWFAFLVAFTVLTPSWRWPAGCIAVVFAGLALGWVAFLQDPLDGIGAAFGALIVDVVTLAVITGSAMYGLGALWLWRRTRRQA
jgi:hypothetical protein